MRAIDKGETALYLICGHRKTSAYGFADMPRKAKRRTRPKKGVDALTAASLTVAPPTLGTAKLTVGEIAAQLTALSPDQSATIERVRHWTREGLMCPVEAHHSGTGRHRRYDRVAPFEAAVLTAIAAAGIHVAPARYLTAALALVRKAFPAWEQARGKAPPLFLEIDHFTKPGLDPVVAIREDTAKHDTAADLTITINLGQLFEDVARSLIEAAGLAETIAGRAAKRPRRSK